MTPEKRARQICETVSGPLRGQAIELATNVCFLAEKLDAEREEVRDEHTFVEVKVGDRNPHYVIRPNPKLRGYTDLVRSYSSALHELRDLLDGAGVSRDKTNSLARYRKKFKAYGGGAGRKEE
ncbi:MAG: hypothetical protein IKE22_12500 [Atopobiaceae bacterium]|nr:hypothetical protein [Atopobiaceae bacterium]